jgi:phosphoribosylformimino-5-aminoimidazole carboxamide ribotide isomerase
MSSAESMVVFPAVDIQRGRCVRLRQGRPEESKTYYEQPWEAALHWQELGARALHVVDLDAALSESDANRQCVLEILKKLSVPAQVGGGLRSEEAVDAILQAGAARAVVGTRAATEPKWAVELCRKRPGRIVVALDVRSGEVAIKGWQEGAGIGVEELARQLEAGPPAAFLCTDVARDGMLIRPNFDSIAKLVRATTVPVIASGGVSCADDVRRLGESGADAVIIGKAFYEGRIQLAEALAAAKPFRSRLVARAQTTKKR